MTMRIGEILRKIKRKVLIKYYGLKNVHPTFLASFGLSKVSNDIYAGAYSYIGPNCIIYPHVTIGNYTMIANNVSIIGADHNFRVAGVPIVFNGRENLLPPTLGKDCWIGANSIIIGGVSIGDGVIVAAGSVVTKNLESYGVYGGIPAIKIKNRFSTIEEIKLHQEMLDEPLDLIENEFKQIESWREWESKLKSTSIE